MRGLASAAVLFLFFMLSFSTPAVQISLSYTPLQRLSSQAIFINLSKSGDRCEVHVSIPPADSSKPESLSIDKSMPIDNAVFARIEEKMKLLASAGVPAAAATGGRGGYSCVVRYSDGSTPVELTAWSPDSDTDTRGLAAYLEVCIELFEAAGLSTQLLRPELFLGC